MIDSAASLDAPTAVEFMREALIKISEDEIATVADTLEKKHDQMRRRLAADRLQPVREDDARWILRHVFATRRRVDPILEQYGVAALGDALHALLYGSGPVAPRFATFDRRLEAVAPPVRRELAAECLRFSEPDQYWLWARWMWDPKTETGSLPLVLVTGYDLHGPDAGVMYDKVGEAVRSVVQTADAIGFQRLKASRFAVDVYLAAIYGVYLYTVTRMRMTQEFNRVIPKLPELVRRLLGVYRLEDTV